MFQSTPSIFLSLRTHSIFFLPNSFPISLTSSFLLSPSFSPSQSTFSYQNYFITNAKKATLLTNAMFSALLIQTECFNLILKNAVVLKMSLLSTFRLIEKLLCSRSLKNFPQLCLQPVFTFPILSNFQVPPLRHQRRPAPFHGPPTFPRRDSPPPPARRLPEWREWEPPGAGRGREGGRSGQPRFQSKIASSRRESLPGWKLKTVARLISLMQQTWAFLLTMDLHLTRRRGPRSGNCWSLGSIPAPSN